MNNENPLPPVTENDARPADAAREARPLPLRTGVRAGRYGTADASYVARG